MYFIIRILKRIFISKSYLFLRQVEQHFKIIRNISKILKPKNVIQVTTSLLVFI